jgi:GT2 family glycosyltransferase
MDNPNKEIKYTVGILIYHRTPELVEMGMDCLRSVINSVNRDETQIIVVDNGSSEYSDFWKANADIYIRFKENMGISRGWNAILKNARGKYINILGDDVQVRPGWLESLTEAIEQPNAGVANVHVQHLPVGKGIIENYKWFSGACFMLTPETIKKVGYFNETIFPCNTEDWEYWIRVYKAGLKLYVNYQSSVMHLEGQTVHAPDLGVHNGRLLRKLAKEVGFDPVPVFCGDVDIHSVLQSK